MRFRMIFVLLGLTLGVAVSGWAESESDNGLDPTNPISRTDLRYQYQNLPPSNHDRFHSLALRGDQLYIMSQEWAWATRLDLPLVITNQASSDNPSGDTKLGFGDVLLQAIVINRPSSTFAWMAGSQFILPTASQDQMGAGKYQIIPSAAARWTLTGQREGSWFAPLVRYAVDVAGEDNRNRIREFQFAPSLNLTLTEGWFLNFYPSSDIRYNFEAQRPGDSGKWFIPFDFLVGRKWSPTTIGTLEVSFPLVQQYQVYDFKIEANIYFLYF
ncbi:MAG: hypothetical protein HY282_10715 [Nitrospirae bacterium]|nr:hypothetical protein [Candidatus Manganitrophaceae bacterium]